MEFEKYRLSDILTLKYGKNQKSVESKDGKYPIYGTGGVMGQSKEYLYDQPTILIGRKGSIENVRFISEPFWAVDTTFYTIINTELVDPYYLYCLLSRLDFKQLDEGTTIPSLRADTLYDLEISLPDLATQKIISSCVQRFDEKIKLNQLINDNLGCACFAA